MRRSLACLTALLCAAGCQFSVPGLDGNGVRDGAVTPPDATGGDLATRDATPPADLSLDGAMLDGAMPDGAMLDGAMPDSAAPDAAMPDGATPDLAMPDLAMPDFAMPDLAMPDFAMPDFAMPDFAMPDFAMPDLVPPPDLVPLPPPTLTSVSPGAARNTGGVTLTITGTGFVTGASVTVAGIACTNVVVQSATSLTCTLPADPGTVGPVAVAVTNPDAQSASRSDLFRYFGTLGFAAAATSLAGVVSQGLGSADFNKDGKPDIAVAHTGGNNIYSMLGNGDGTLQTAKTFGCGNAPDNIEFADLDGDGKVDLVTENSQNANPGIVAILPGNGDGTFKAAMALHVDSWPNWVKIGSFGGVAGKDLVTGNYAVNDVSVLLKNGATTFSYATVKNTATATGANIEIAVADFNQDGKQDVVTTVARTGTDSYSVLLGNGDGTFQAARSALVGNSAWGVVAPDLNGDGKADIAIADYFDSDVLVILGNGDGTFAAPVKVATLDGNGTDLTTADYDGDGIADLAVCAASANKVDVLTGAGDGTTFTMKGFDAGLAGDAIITVDLNVDGRPDLALTDGTTGGLSILLNTTQ